jgi:hypothetical protein
MWYLPTGNVEQGVEFKGRVEDSRWAEAILVLGSIGNGIGTSNINLVERIWYWPTTSP